MVLLLGVLVLTVDSIVCLHLINSNLNQNLSLRFYNVRELYYLVGFNPKKESVFIPSSD